MQKVMQCRTLVVVWNGIHYFQISRVLSVEDVKCRRCHCRRPVVQGCGVHPGVSSVPQPPQRLAGALLPVWPHCLQILQGRSQEMSNLPPEDASQHDQQCGRFSYWASGAQMPVQWSRMWGQDVDQGYKNSWARMPSKNCWVSLRKLWSNCPDETVQ